jgi:hypothetical protein
MAAMAQLVAPFVPRGFFSNIVAWVHVLLRRRHRVGVGM